MNHLIPEQIYRDKDCSQSWKLTLLILTWEYPPNVVGGLSRHVYGLSVQLAAMGHDVHIITAGNHTLPALENMNGVTIHRVVPLNNQDDHFLNWIAGLNLAMAYKAEKITKEIKVNLIHAHDWLVGSAALIIKGMLSVPLLSTIHATEHGRNNGIYTDLQQFINRQEKLLIEESDQLIVCSEYMKEELHNVFQASNKEINVIPNGIEYLEVKGDLHENFSFLKNREYVFSIGRIVKEKGFELMIEAASMAKEKGFDFYIVIAGKGPMLETYRQVVAERELDNYIVFIGYVTDEQRNNLILNSNMVVIPSLYEPFGITALEAMILAKPTIVSETGGLKGIVKHLKTGMLIVPGDVNSLIENINHLIKNPQLAKEMGRKASQIVRALYCWKRIALETEVVIREMQVNMKSRVRFEMVN